ncbi:MAG: helix-turn-helix domain-containing protein [Ilumatobacteraceae bacterium]
MDPDLVERAAVHAALGEPVRLAIVDELVRSDRAPSELAARFDLSTNLLAHHLAVLERVGLVERSVSSGDRRRRYVRIVATGRADPTGCADPTGPGVRAEEQRRRDALFVCTHNSARSQLAAAIWRQRTGASATSAGTSPAERVHPGAVAAARRRGLDLGRSVPRRLAATDLATADLVVTVCDRAHEEVDLPSEAVHWSVPDPVAVDGDSRRLAVGDPFDLVVELLDRRITAFAATGPTRIATQVPIPTATLQL